MRAAATFVAVVRSEWTKARTVRSTSWTLLLTFVISVGVGVVNCLSVKKAIEEGSSLVRADFHPADAGFVGVGMGQLVLVVFVVLLVCGEYSGGMIRTSLTAVPRRGLLYGGKLAVGAGLALAVSLVTVPVAFLASERALGSLAVPLDGPGVPRALVGAVVGMTLIAVFSGGVAVVLRGAAVSLGVLVPFHFVLPTLMLNIPGLRTIAVHLPTQAGARIMRVAESGDATLSPGAGLIVLLGWTVAATLGGYVALRTRDV
ncbi:ABC transporter permease [Streptomyces phaeolivaceus]|uniref:ABC transporter permease n=1 Tax=Streptomyces phaeolivaceus TaxID=2653200 RepID=A0A5P8K0M3_9ACTN|nr:ABC transporter permease [Streptomyces phaeolivaceus]QFQ96805.1 ABC transporter permease [Streptomyces phaeolivaceus]